MKRTECDTCMFLAFRVKLRAAPPFSIWSKRFLMAPQRTPSRPFLAEKYPRFPPKSSTGSQALSLRAKRRADHALACKLRTSSDIPGRLRGEGDVHPDRGSPIRSC